MSDNVAAEVEEDSKAVLVERDALRVEVAALQSLILADRDRHAAELADAEQRAYDDRAALANLQAGDDELKKILREPPEVTEAFLERLRSEHRLRPLLRHIDMSDRQKELDHLRHLTVDQQERHAKLGELAERLAREKHEAAERERGLRADLIHRERRILELEDGAREYERQIAELRAKPKG